MGLCQLVSSPSELCIVMTCGNWNSIYQPCTRSWMNLILIVMHHRTSQTACHHPLLQSFFVFSLSSFNPIWLVSLLFQVLLWLYLPVLEIEVWSGCHAGHIVESCMVYRMDHEIPGRVAPDGTSFLHPGSDLDYTKYPGLSLDCVFDFSILW